MLRPGACNMFPSSRYAGGVLDVAVPLVRAGRDTEETFRPLGSASASRGGLAVTWGLGRSAEQTRVERLSPMADLQS